MKKMELTMLVEKGENGYYVGQIQEYPSAVSQGKTIEELKDNLVDAIKLLLDFEKEKIEKSYAKRKFFRRKLVFTL